MKSNPEKIPENRTTAGFTLLELLVALAVFSVMSVMAYSGLVAMLDSRNHAGQETARLGRLQQAFVLMQRDFSQFVNRQVRDEYGESRPALYLPRNTANTIEFTCGGRHNPGGGVRSSLQRVAYQYGNGRLLRLSWPVLDRVAGSVPYTQTLLAEVDDFVIEFLNRDGEWVLPHTTNDLPPAIRVSLNIGGWGRISRQFLFAPG